MSDSGGQPQLPALEEETAFFWTSGEDGTLRIQRCADCNHWQHPPLPRCGACGSENVAPQPVSGRGRVKSHTVNVQKWSADMQVPFVFAAIELAEQDGLYVFSRVTDPAEDVAAGAEVAVHFERHDDVWLPLFTLADGGGA